MKNTPVLFVLVSFLGACAGVSSYKHPMPSPMVAPTLAEGNPCGLYLDPSGETGAYSSSYSLDLFGTAPTAQAEANARVMDASGRFIERCSNGSARVIMARGFAEAWKHPFSSNPVWQKVGMGMNEAADKDAERERVKKVYEMYLKNMAKLKGGKGGTPAEAAPAADQVPSASPASAPAAPATGASLGLRSKVAMATSLPDIASALSAEAQKGGTDAARYQGMADSISALPATTDVQAEKTKVLNVLPR
jgi:hypothetical protein